MAVELNVSEDHPLALELTSLRSAVSRYQHEAHTASVKLQRHSLDTTHALEGAKLLEQENRRLSEELGVLRANPDLTPHPDSLKVPELTLALRKLSDKLTFTEETLLSRTSDLVSAQNALAQARQETGDARHIANLAKAGEEAARARERELERKVKAAEEERKMADMVVQEYADLVRNLEGRSKGPRPSIQVTREASSSSVTLVESLAEGKTGLQKLLGEFNVESERHASDMFELQGKLDVAHTSLESERKNVEDLRSQLAAALAKLDEYKADDNTAAKMVSRYMKFSQSTTDSLQKAMDNLKARHAATTSSYERQVESLRKSLQFERRQSETLRRALDELSEDISREAYGRRREISLRLAFLGREEGLAENLRRWIRKSKETFSRVLSKQPQPTDNSPLVEAFNRIVQDAERLMETLNGLQTSEEEPSAGSIARLLAAQDAVATLTRELHQETSRRLEAERRLTHFESLEGDPDTIPSATVLSPGGFMGNGSAFKLSDLPERTVSLPASPPPLVEARSSSNDGAPPSIETSQAQDQIVGTSSSVVSPTPDSISDALLQEAGIGAVPTTQPVAVEQQVTEIEDESSASHLTCGGDLDAESNTGDTVVSHNAVPMSSVEQELSPLPEIIVATVDLPVVPTGEQVHGAIIIPHGPDISLAVLGGGHEPPHDVIHDTTAVAPVAANASPSRSFTSLLSASPDLDTQQQLLADLRSTKHRYDDLQRSFRDCDIALKDLKREVGGLPDNLEAVLIVHTAVDRLKDYNEDARVELEIRISDEERIYSGYTTLLSIPGAISDEVDTNELENQIHAFVSGTDSAVAKAMQHLSRKLDDLQHDIASIKLTVHELAASTENQAESDPHSAGTQGGWSSWTGGLLGSSRPSSPAPTFGSVMTSPRLRHSVSLSRMNSSTGGEAHGASNTPFTGLGLRIPMPAHVTPRRPSTLPTGRPGPRPRVSSSSAMYLLGLGARSGSFSSQKPAGSPMGRKMSLLGKDGEVVESDIE
ncbi:hypothetical protein BXZ70DRAFT_259831 [Cristinia sonorae]|uniref:Uncharacterized protein n=1 Tax=Cristinia sonorae TaxID=1940300 RepID=A0A8K0UWU4_9AGAR|nr:hypothetical protein BXZ70DRAFT_259831 [Cristinia sonorae]